jgi:hypothetical protein
MFFERASHLFLSRTMDVYSKEAFSGEEAAK